MATETEGTYDVAPVSDEAVSQTQPSSRSNFVRGAFCGLSAVGIWAAFIVVSRLGMRSSLTPWDVAAVRFGVAGALLLGT